MFNHSGSEEIRKYGQWWDIQHSLEIQIRRFTIESSLETYLGHFICRESELRLLSSAAISVL